MNSISCKICTRFCFILFYCGYTFIIVRITWIVSLSCFYRYFIFRGIFLWTMCQWNNQNDTDKNTERHTAHTIVSWHNPKQWVIVHTSDLMMLIRQSIYIYIYIFSQSSQGKWVNWKHTTSRIVSWITERMCPILLTHSTKYIWQLYLTNITENGSTKLSAYLMHDTWYAWVWMSSQWKKLL